MEKIRISMFCGILFAFTTIISSAATASVLMLYPECIIQVDILKKDPIDHSRSDSYALMHVRLHSAAPNPKAYVDASVPGLSEMCKHYESEKVTLKSGTRPFDKLMFERLTHIELGVQEFSSNTADSSSGLGLHWEVTKVSELGTPVPETLKNTYQGIVASVIMK